MKKLITIFMLIATISVVNSQNTNVRAQGNYYSAKSNFENKNFSEALNYIYKCKTSLGGINRELQYLHILTAYNLKKWEEANKELEKYFNIEEKKIIPVRFDKSVELLTSDETKALSMLMDPIIESYEKWRDHPCTLCKGSGLIDKTYSLVCDTCNGEGFTKSKCRGNNFGCFNGGYSCRCVGRCIGFSNGYQCYFGYHEYFDGNYNVKKRCKMCNNEGQSKCENCDGKGYVKNKCNVCNGLGKKQYTSTSQKAICNQCSGNGF